MPLVTVASALLVATSAYVQHECTLDDASCTVTCAACETCTAPSYTYNLSAYATPAKGWLEVDGTASNGTVVQYYYAVCPSATTGEWLDPEQIRCGAPPPEGMQPSVSPLPWQQGTPRWVGVVAEEPVANSSACESSPCTLSDCATLGRADESTCTADGTAGLTCTYGGGTVFAGVARSVEFRFSCAGVVGAATAHQAVEAAEGLAYVIDLPGPAGCGVAVYPPPPSPSAEAPQGPGLSGGSLFCIALAAAAAVYLCGGVAYNYKVHDAPLGFDAVPQIGFWRQLPGLLQDGGQLVYAQCNRAYAAVRDRNKDPALTRSLARSDGEVEPGDEMAAVLAL